MTFSRTLPLASLTILALAGCGDSGNEPRQLPGDARIAFDTDPIEVNVGSTADVGATLVNAAGQPITGFTLSFDADEAGPVDVSSSGTITAVSAGAGRVRVSVGTRVLDSVDVDVFGHPQGIADPSVALNANPFGVAISRQGVGLVTRLGGGVITANTGARTLGNPITVGSTPTGIAIDPAGTTAYVANQGSSSLGIVDIASSTQVFTVNLTSNPFATAVSPNGQRAYVTTNANKVYVINTATRTIVDSVATGSTPNSISFSRDGSRFYVANAHSGTVSEVNAATNVVTRNFNVGGVPQEVVASRDGSRLYVSNEDGRVDVVSLPAGTVGTPIQLGVGAFGMALSPDQARLYVSLLSGGVRVIDTSTLTAGATIATGTDASNGWMSRRIAFDFYGTRALVANEGGSVTFIR